MNSLYDDGRAIVKEILGDLDFKQGVIEYIAVTPGAGPAHKPGASTEVPYTFIGAAARGVKFKYVQSGLALASDLQVVTPVDDRFTPDMKGFIRIDGTRYKIVSFQPIPPAGVTVSWLFIVRK